LGRQWTSVLDCQPHEPSWAGFEVTVMCFWNAALSVTGTSNFTTTGMANADRAAGENRREDLLLEGQILGGEGCGGGCLDAREILAR